MDQYELHDNLTKQYNRDKQAQLPPYSFESPVSIAAC